MREDWKPEKEPNMDEEIELLKKWVKEREDFMKSKWKVGYRREGVSVQYCAYRLLNVALSDNPSNREYDRNWYHKRESAERAAAVLNEEGA